VEWAHLIRIGPCSDVCKAHTRVPEVCIRLSNQLLGCTLPQDLGLMGDEDGMSRPGSIFAPVASMCPPTPAEAMRVSYRAEVAQIANPNRRLQGLWG
jgi:hypothetical protein